MEKKPSKAKKFGKLYCWSHTVFKVGQSGSSHRDPWPTPTTGQDSDFASRMVEIQSRSWDHSAESVSACWPEASGAHKGSHDAHMSPIGPNHQALVGGEGGKTDRGTEEERVEETVAAAHSASASHLEAPVEDAQCLELGRKSSHFSPSNTSWFCVGSQM